MLLFAIFTLGYFGGVITTLAIFPPRTKEIEEQEKDSNQYSSSPVVSTSVDQLVSKPVDWDTGVLAN